MDQPTYILTKLSFHSQVVMTTKESVSTNFLLGDAIRFVETEDIAQNLVTPRGMCHICEVRKYWHAGRSKRVYRSTSSAAVVYCLSVTIRFHHGQDQTSTAVPAWYTGVMGT
jgi:hypothetical protein